MIRWSFNKHTSLWDRVEDLKEKGSKAGNSYYEFQSYLALVNRSRHAVSLWNCGRPASVSTREPFATTRTPATRNSSNTSSAGMVSMDSLWEKYKSIVVLWLVPRNREIPPELIRESRGKEVHLQMEDHRTEEFISKKTRFQVDSFTLTISFFLAN